MIQKSLLTFIGLYFISNSTLADYISIYSGFHRDSAVASIYEQCDVESPFSVSMDLNQIITVGCSKRFAKENISSLFKCELLGQMNSYQTFGLVSTMCNTTKPHSVFIDGNSQMTICCTVVSK